MPGYYDLQETLYNRRRRQSYWGITAVLAAVVGLGGCGVDYWGGSMEVNEGQVLRHEHRDPYTSWHWVSHGKHGGHLQPTNHPEQWTLVVRVQNEIKSISVTKEWWGQVTDESSVPLQRTVGRYTGWKYGWGAGEHSGEEDSED